MLAEDPHQALGVVQDLGAGRIRTPGGERPLVGLVQLGRVEPGGRALGGGQRHLCDAAAAQGPDVHGGHTERPGAVLGQPRGELAGAQHRAVHLDSGGRRRLLGALLGARVDGVQPVAQALVTDLQGAQEHLERLAVVGPARQLLGAAGQLDVADHLRQPAVELDRLQVLAEVGARLALDLLGALHQLRERAELVDPLRGGLLADAGDAGEVVGRVAAQRREVRVLGGGQAVLLEDLLRGEAGQLGDALGGVEDRDVVGDQLEGVAVAGDDGDLEALRDGLLGQRGDHVVGLEPLDGEPLDVQGVEQLADQLDLALELVGRLGAVRLVVGELRRAPRLARDVEGHREMRGRLVAQGVREHRREAVDRIGRLPGGGGEILHGQGEERPVCHGMPIHQEQVGTAARRLGAGRFALLRCLCCHAPDPATPH